MLENGLEDEQQTHFSLVSTFCTRHVSQVHLPDEDLLPNRACNGVDIDAEDSNFDFISLGSFVLTFD
jgi:hypothetical protein